MSVALVLGCGKCVWDDARAALSLFNPDAYFCVKDMVRLWPLRCDYYITLHPDRIAKDLEQRKRSGRSIDFPVYAHRQHKTVVTKTATDWQGSSGLFATKIALLDEHFDAVVLAGVPMEAKFDHIARQKVWASVNLYIKGWQKHLPELQGKVKSMSGWTQKNLGAPDANWLQQHGAMPSDPGQLARLEEATRRAETALPA